MFHKNNANFRSSVFRIAYWLRRVTFSVKRELLAMNDQKRSRVLDAKKTLFQPVKAKPARKRKKSAFAKKSARTDHHIEWEAIGFATFAVFVWSVIVGFAFGLLAIISSFTIRHLIDDSVVRSLFTLFGLLVGFLPLVKGTENLIMNIREDYQSHCLIFATVVFLLNALILVLVHDSETGLLDWLSLFLTYPVVILTCHLSTNKVQQRSDRQQRRSHA